MYYNGDFDEISEPEIADIHGQIYLLKCPRFAYDFFNWFEIVIFSDKTIHRAFRVFQL